MALGNHDSSGTATAPHRAHGFAVRQRDFAEISSATHLPNRLLRSFVARSPLAR
ncbi:hypothetical protein [Haladaptatus cibarius]|uniref:hypothetical protein n=1 Tax=Haladaptatus cibarius TaxID=453847 RepID=UPI00130E2B12|nr:hypothetical protein [Haladaptatus cibarius]